MAVCDRSHSPPLPSPPPPQTKRENAGKKKDWGNVDDPLRNGTYVRYGAGVLFVLLLGGIFWAFRDGLESKDHRHKRVGKLV